MMTIVGLELELDSTPLVSWAAPSKSLGIVESCNNNTTNYVWIEMEEINEEHWLSIGLKT